MTRALVLGGAGFVGSAACKELMRRGFRFVGPTTVYSTLQSCGLVSDHISGCYVRGEVEREQRGARSDSPH